MFTLKEQKSKMALPLGVVREGFLEEVRFSGSLRGCCRFRELEGWRGSLLENSCRRSMKRSVWLEMWSRAGNDKL